MKVATGGTLYTHIPNQLGGALDHDYPVAMRTAIVHPVNIDETTRSTAEILGETLPHVNRLHHQGLEHLGGGLRAAGHASDALVELVELVDHRFGVAVQWHPEWSTEHPAVPLLFPAFAQASGK
jgi:gamma-glutamyl-gamma-aminobutyrate hydrolase PuuD